MHSRIIKPNEKISSKPGAQRFAAGIAAIFGAYFCHTKWLRCGLSDGAENRISAAFCGKNKAEYKRKARWTRIIYDEWTAAQKN